MIGRSSAAQRSAIGQAPQVAPAPRPAPLAAAHLLLLIAICSAVAAAAPGQLMPLAAIASLQLVVATGAMAADGRSLRLALLVAVASGGFIVVYWLQQNLPPLSTAAGRVWLDAQTALAGEAVVPRAALGAWGALSAVSGPLLAGSAMACGILIGSNARAARSFIDRFAIFIGAYAGIAIVFHTLRPDYALWWRKLAHENDLTGAFTNRNTAAIFIGMGLIVLAVGAVRLLDERRRARGVASGRARRRVVLNALAIVTCIVAVVMTNSRAGSVLALLLAGFAFWLRQRGRGRAVRSGMPMAIALCALLAFIAALALFDLRLATALSDGGGRRQAFAAEIAMIWDNPWLGVGLGGFAASFPQWRLADAAPWGVWTRAHNIVLELAVEAGIPFALVMIGLWIWIGVRLVPSALRPGASKLEIVPLAVYLLGFGQAQIDFAIQIPACAIVFYAIVGIGLTRSFRPPSRSGRLLRPVDEESTPTAAVAEKLLHPPYRQLAARGREDEAPCASAMNDSA